MTKLRPACEFETNSVECSLQTDLERRFGFDDLSDLAKILKTAIGPRDCRAAEWTDEDDRRSRFELDRRGT